MSLDVQPGADETLDTLLRGRVHLLQSRKGYRTSVDAMALAWFATAGRPPPRRCVDLGAGSGLVGILVGRHHATVRLQLVERQPELAARARRNLALNGLLARADLLVHDIAEPLPALEAADLVVCNPPYRRPESNAVPLHPERRLAHCESSASLERFAAVAAGLLADHGAACFVYPHAGHDRLLAALASAGLARQEVAVVRHRAGDPQPVRVLVRASRGVASRLELASVALHPADTPDHTYAREIESFLRTL